MIAITWQDRLDAELDAIERRRDEDVIACLCSFAKAAAESLVLAQVATPDSPGKVPSNLIGFMLGGLEDDRNKRVDYLVESVRDRWPPGEFASRAEQAVRDAFRMRYDEVVTAKTPGRRA